MTRGEEGGVEILTAMRSNPMKDKSRFALLCLLLWVIPTTAQTVTDLDRRGFDDLQPIFIDVDGDGKKDRLNPRTYQTRSKLRGGRPLKKHIKNWITFDLKTSRGLSIKSLFTYNYGTAETGGSYWVYALIPVGDVNKDRKLDLMFYAGDDTSDETVILLNQGNRFTVRSKKTSDSDGW